MEYQGTGLRGDHSQEPGFGIFRSDNPSAHSTLRHAATEPSLHWRHQRQAAGRFGWAEEGGCHRGAQCFWAAAVVKIERMAGIEEYRRQKGRLTNMNARKAHYIWIE